MKNPASAGWAANAGKVHPVPFGCAAWRSSPDGRAKKSEKMNNEKEQILEGTMIHCVPMENVHKTLTTNIPLKGDGRWLARVKGQGRISEIGAKTYAAAAQQETPNQIYIEKYDGDTCVFGRFW